MTSTEDLTKTRLQGTRSGGDASDEEEGARTTDGCPNVWWAPPQSTRVSPTHGVDGHTSLKAHSARAWSRSKRRGLPQVSPTRALPRSSRRGQLEGRHDIVTPHSFKAGSRWAVTRAACRDTEGGCARDSLALFVLGTSTRSFDEASSGQGRRRLPSSAPVLVPGLSRLGSRMRWRRSRRVAERAAPRLSTPEASSRGTW